MWVWLITPRAPSRGAQQACGGCRHPARRSRAGARRHCLLVPTAHASTIDLRRAADAGKWAKWLSKTQPCVMHFAGNIKTGCRQRSNAETTPVGFEPTRGDPIGLAGRRLNRSAKVSLRAISKYSDLCKPGSHSCRLGKQPQREACAALRNIYIWACNYFASKSNHFASVA